NPGGDPPGKALIILVSQAPGSLLPTTRSRCWHIALRPLEQEEMAHALRTLKVTASEGDDALLGVLAEGSPGKALGLLGNGGGA
ncbi:MAG TPA: DNA polymerase III subunit delta', partial [Alphaproteobacteria bacterium]|nr:DNA polymerase III subunit delta' [Alphaproteobacteria bacterium]